MTVDAGGTVSVVGDLQVGGSVSEGEIPADLGDPRFVSLLAELVARRVVRAAATPTTRPPFGLEAEVVTGESGPATTTVEISLSVDQDRVLTGWGAALEVRRQDATVATLLRVGNRTTSADEITFRTTRTWTPQLSAASPATLTVAVAAFDTRGTLAAQSVDLGPFTGEDT
jgi:hypothetical protein